MKLKKLLSAVLAGATILSSLTIGSFTATADEKTDTETPWKNPYVDIKAGEWYYDSVSFVSENNLFKGNDKNEFLPGGTMTRAMFCTVLARIDRADFDGYGAVQVFNDVLTGTWYTEAVEWAYRNEIVTGKGNRKFDPDGQITRAEMCVILDRYYTLHGMKLTDPTLNFADNASIADWATAAVSSCKSFGIVNGIAENKKTYFKPAGIATRAEAAAVLERFCKLFDLPMAGIVAVTDVYKDVDVDGIKAMRNQLQGLVDDCTALKLSCAYEEAAIADFDVQIEWLENDIASVADHEKIPSERIRDLNKIYMTTRDALVSYKYGLDKPLEVYNFDITTIRVEGNNLVAKYADGTEGAVYATGYGHWVGSLSPSIPLFPKLALTTVQVDIGVGRMLVPRGQGSHEGLLESDPFDLDLTLVTNQIVPFLEQCEENNVSVCLLFCINAFTSEMLASLKETDPTMFQKNSNTMDVAHPMVRRAQEAAINAVMPYFKDQKAVFSYCLTNEPSYDACAGDYDLPLFRDYIEERYDTIENVNATIGTTYASFDDINWPEAEERDGLYYIYTRFNAELFAGWHEFAAKEIQKYTDKPCSAKISGWIKWINNYGDDVEMFDEFCDLAGCDSFSFCEDGSNRYEKHLWYTYLYNATGSPIYNSEDHMVQEAATVGEYDGEALADHVYMDLMQGALEGRAANAMWTWYPLTRDDKTYGYVGNTSDKPLCLNATSRAALDCMRLHTEIEAFNDADPEVWLLLSKSSMMKYIGGSNHAYDALDYCYKVAVTLGKKVGVTSDDKIASAVTAGDVVIVPDCERVSAAAAETLATFAEDKSIQVILYDYSGACLAENEYARPTDPDVLARIKKNSKIFTSADATYDPLYEYISTFYKWIDANTSAISFKMKINNNRNVAFQAVKYKDGYLMDVCNFSMGTTNQNCNITYGNANTKVAEYTDLITGKTYTAESGITLAPSQVALLYFEID